MTILTDVLRREGYNSADDLVRDWSLMVALTKVDQYQAECDFFQHKYQMVLEEFERQIHAEQGVEDFTQEEDLEDWEFAVQALKWWQAKVRGLRAAANV